MGKDSAWSVDGTCPGARGGKGKVWSATLTVKREGGGTATHRPTPPRPCPTPRDSHSGHDSTPCTPPKPDHGVHAGSGGTFTDSVPALAAGALLIAGACGGALYRLRRRTARLEG
ncbi:hypothetical protein ACIQNG_18035 [Streptomyces sp. NPDC091377]|uniref:hypothetical protein n=1 Tax=Streptomyces sp. NPDC091377 TaxID=3365995 RepID=UPI0037F50797